MAACLLIQTMHSAHNMQSRLTMSWLALHEMFIEADQAHRLAPQLVVDELARVGLHDELLANRLEQLRVIADLQCDSGRLFAKHLLRTGHSTDRRVHHGLRCRGRQV